MHDGSIHRAGDEIASTTEPRHAVTDAGAGPDGSALPDDVESMFGEYRASRSPELRNRLVMRYLHVADRCARRYSHRGEPIADLVQVSRMALVRAVERFDPDRGVRFEAYASPTILGEMAALVGGDARTG